ncbi:hypothetical protein RR42_s2425 [Cupriavidus basilensis]|uniref:Uncharacterized protein n=1 Tax=Cupriavidus basilensis TaxID=68895 RepID=A0A0C4YE70_9BURK|nr:hypothetical protein RR42_s2425 [Cupriavidus basilensis]
MGWCTAPADGFCVLYNRTLILLREFRWEDRRGRGGCQGGRRLGGIGGGVGFCTQGPCDIPPGHGARHETRGLDSKMPLAQVRQGIKWPGGHR